MLRFQTQTISKRQSDSHCSPLPTLQIVRLLLAYGGSDADGTAFLSSDNKTRTVVTCDVICGVRCDTWWREFVVGLPHVLVDRCTDNGSAKTVTHPLTKYDQQSKASQHIIQHFNMSMPYTHEHPEPIYNIYLCACRYLEREDGLATVRGCLPSGSGCTRMDIPHVEIQFAPLYCVIHTLPTHDRHHHAGLDKRRCPWHRQYHKLFPTEFKQGVSYTNLKKSKIDLRCENHMRTNDIKTHARR